MPDQGAPYRADSRSGEFPSSHSNKLWIRGLNPVTSAVYSLGSSHATAVPLPKERSLEHLAEPWGLPLALDLTGHLFCPTCLTFLNFNGNISERREENQMVPKNTDNSGWFCHPAFPSYSCSQCSNSIPRNLYSFFIF